MKILSNLVSLSYATNSTLLGLVRVSMNTIATMMSSANVLWKTNFMAKAISLSACKTPHSAIRNLLGSNLVRILLSLARIYLRLHLNGISYVAIFSLLSSLFVDVFVQVQPRIIFITGQIQQNMV